MKYKIGDVSNMLHLSDQMIRYYEKNGVIYPERKENSTYRLYSAMDIFLLFDAMRYKELGINIHEIPDLLSNDFFEKYTKKIGDYEQELNRELQRKQILIERLEEIRKKIYLCSYNQNNYWVDEIPAQVVYEVGPAKGDHYDQLDMGLLMSNVIYDPEYISFFDAGFEFQEDLQMWNYAIEQRFHDVLKIDDKGKYQVQGKQLCLCTIADLGELGNLNQHCANNAVAYVKKHGYHQAGNPRAVIIGRGGVDHRFTRLVEIMIPIESL